MDYCKRCGSELDEVGKGRYRCTNTECELAEVDVGKDGKELAPVTIEVSDEIAEIKKRLSFSKVAPIAEKLLPYLTATLDWGLNPEWRKVGEMGNPPRCFDPWFLGDVCANTGLGVPEIEYFCGMLKPFAALEEIRCEYSTGRHTPYVPKNKRIALSPAFVSHLKSTDFGSAEFTKTGIDMLRSYVLLCGEQDSLDSLSEEFKDEHWRWVIGRLGRSHYSSPSIADKPEETRRRKAKERLTLFKYNHFYMWADHYFGSSGEIGPPNGERGASNFAGHPSFSNSISGLKPREIARRLKDKLPRKLENLRMSKASVLKLRESFDKGDFLNECEYEPRVLEELQEKGLIDIEDGTVIPSFSKYGLRDFIEEKDSEIVRELKTWLDILDE